MAARASAEPTIGSTIASDIGGAYQFGMGLASGTARGIEQGALSAVKLGANVGQQLGVISKGTAGTVGGLAADVTNLGNIYAGLQRGGVTGYTGAATNAAQLYSRLPTSVTGLSAAEAGTLGKAAGGLASALAVYEFARNWQSGATGSEALQGAQVGASIGTTIAPGVGTLIGAGIGAAAGAVSSIFGPGREDPENVGWNQYAQAFQQHGAAGVQGANPSQNFQMLSGIFDARGSNIPFYGRYGRMGENQFTGDMFRTVNQALASGKLAPNATPQQIYSQVVEPWISSMSPRGWQNTSTIQGAPEKQAIGNLLTSMIGQWRQGQITSSTRLGIGGQTLQGGVPAYGASGISPQAQATQQSAQQTFAQQIGNAATSLGGILGIQGTQPAGSSTTQPLGASGTYLDNSMNWLSTLGQQAW
jgi:hypothetical protein